MLAVAAIVGLVVAAIVDLWQKNEEFRNAVTEAWNGIKDTLRNIWETILKPIFDAFVGMLMDIWNNGLKPLWNKWKEFVEQIVLLITDLWNGMKPVVDWIIKTFGPAFVEVFKFVFNTIKNIVMLIINIVSSLLSAFSGIIEGIRKIFKGLIDFIVGIFTGDWRRAWEGVKQIFKGVFDSLWGIVKVPLNLIIDGINWVIGGLNRLKIKIPDWVRYVPGLSDLAGKTWGINISKISKLAHGGIIDSPTLAMLGEAGREAVLPLENNTGWIDILAGKLASAMQGAQLAGAGGDIYVYIGNEQVDAYIYRSQDRRNIRSNGRG